MSTVQAVNVNDITKLSIGITIALVVIGLLLALVITALIGRLLILAVVVVLAVFVWQQRGHVRNDINEHKCNLHATFFGFHLDAPQSVIQACNKNT